MVVNLASLQAELAESARNQGTLMRKCFAVAALLFVGAASADDSCNYSSTPGTEFEFAVRDESLRQYGYRGWSATPDIDTTLSYDAYVGRKGKFTGTKTSAPGRTQKFHDVILDDCSKAYYSSIRENLADEPFELTGLKFLQMPPHHWKAELRVDDMTDAKSCNITPRSQKPFPIIVYHNKGKAVTVRVVGGDFPGKDVMFRVDKQTAISESENLENANAQRLVQQIRAGGKTLLVRSYEWPDESPDTKEFNLDGLVAELDACKALLK